MSNSPKSQQALEPFSYKYIQEVREDFAEATVPERIDYILQIEKSLKASDLPPQDDGLHETLVNKIYTRTIQLPAGTVAVGEIHKQAHTNILSQGSVLVATEDGTQIIKAPHVWHGQPGVKRVSFVLEDVVWTTIHATDNTESEDIRREFVAESYDEVSLLEEDNGMGSNSGSSGINTIPVESSEES